ncbi:MAG: DegT/DnrJ/EryC1/StrS family aminotransferase [Thermomicrobiales bacterium]
MTDERLALHGGAPVRTAPLPSVNDASGRTFGDEELALLEQVIRSGRLNRNSGSMVRQLETGFAAWVGAAHCVASTSGTSALHLAVGALDLNPGDEVITTPITDFGTIIPILMQNGVPVFADIDPETWCLDPADVARKVTPRTRAIIAVHLFGQPADLDPLLALAREHNLVLIEDCSQAYGTRYRDRPTGVQGRIGCYSLQQSKHMSAGDGGLTVTNDPALDRRMRLFADKGWPRDGDRRTHLFLAPNYRMTELQGAVALAQLGKVGGVIARRRTIAARLDACVSDLPGLRPPHQRDGDHVTYWLYPLHYDAAALGVPVAEFCRALAAEGVPAGAGYVPPVYHTPVLRELQTYGSSGFPFGSPYTTRTGAEYKEALCPMAEAMSARMLTLSDCEGFSDADVDDIDRALTKVATHYAVTNRQSSVGSRQ